MKFKKWVLFAIPVVVLFGLQSFQVIKTQDKKSLVHNDKLKKYSVTLGAQSNKTKGGFMNISQGEVLQLSGASRKQNDIDFLYAYGKSTGINLIVPSSSRLKGFGSYRRNVMDKWSVLNKGSFVNMMHDKSARQLFKKVKTNGQLVKAYKGALKKVKTLRDYKVITHGPALSLRRMEVGDIFLFKSAGKNIYAIGRLVASNPGYSGDILIDLKVADE